MSRIIISSRIFIPTKDVSKKQLKEHYSFLDFDDMGCKICPTYKAGKRFDKEKCGPCDSFKGRVDLYKKKTFNGKKYYGIPVANPRRAEAKLGIDLSRAKDIRPDVPMKSNLKFVQKLRDGSPDEKGRPTCDQVALVKDALKGLKKYNAGILQALPRSGKCVVGSTIITTSKGIIPIKSLFSEDMEEGAEIPISGLSIDTEKGFKEVSHLYWKTVDKTVCVMTSGGHRIEGTPNHPMLIYREDAGYSWVNLEDLKIGDCFCIPKDHTDESFIARKKPIKSWVHSPITSINEKNMPVKVYDVCVPETHSFIANGCISHNTVMAANIACHLKQRTVILANKEKLLQQFQGTFEGDDKYINFTNAKEEAERLGHPVTYIVRTPADFKRSRDADVVLVLYQKLIRSTSVQRVYDFILDEFGLVIIDEVHRGSAVGFASLLARLNTKYRLGLSATPKNKKDERNLVLSETVGRVIAKSDSVNLAPRMEVFETGLQVGKPPRLWVYAIKHLCKSHKRNVMIVREVFSDLRAGRKAILIPVSFTDHMEMLVDMINSQAEYNNRHKGEDWPYPMAVPYCGAMTEKAKKSAMENFDTGKAKVMVAITSMVVEGVDLSIPDMLYQVIPMSAKEGVGAPSFEQLTFRVATPAPGKTDPVVKMFIDGLPQSYWCFRSTFMFEVSPGIAKDKKKYRMKRSDFERATQICDELRSNRTYVPKNMLGTKVISSELIEGYDPERRKAKKAQTTIKKNGLVKLRG